jgi:hypothetical protein
LDRREVVGARALVVEGHAAVALEVTHAEWDSWRVDGQLLVVNADAVAVGVGVGEEARLQDWVGTGLDTRDQVCGVEGDLLDFGEVVLHILVEEELSNFPQRELGLGPDMRHVEDVDLLLLPDLLCLLGSHCLDLDVPTGEVALLDGLVEVLRRVVGSVVERVFLRDEGSALF